MITYEMFDILMTEYEERMDHWMEQRMRGGDYEEQLEQADNARIMLKQNFPEYFAQRKELLEKEQELFRYAVESDHDYLDIPFLPF